VHPQGQKFACVYGASYSMVLHTQLYYAPHTATWTLFLFFMHYALHTPLRTAFFWVVMRRVVVRNYHYLLCYNPEERSSQLLLSRSLKSFMLLCYILYILCYWNIVWQAYLCQTSSSFGLLPHFPGVPINPGWFVAMIYSVIPVWTTKHSFFLPVPDADHTLNMHIFTRWQNIFFFQTSVPSLL
jgi:hypothetical protein